MIKDAEQKLFGTDGIRGAAGKFPLDEKTVEMIGRSLTTNLTRAIGRAPSILIGRDTRESGPQIERALARGAVDEGARVESAGIITTPGVAFLTRVTPFDAGAVISASHNPYHDNGIKVFSPSGKKMSDELERAIEEELRGLVSAGEPSSYKARPKNFQLDGYVDGYKDQHARFRRQYIDYLVEEVAVGLKLDRMRFAIDCANGAASDIAPDLFARLGAKLETLSASPDGRNINEGCGSLHPETLQQAVVEGSLDLGIAFDGDADRALFVDERGNLVDGDHLLLMLADYLKQRGKLAGDMVVATVMSNLGLEVALRERGIALCRTSVGDRYVLDELLARGGSLGGEQSGHIIFPEISLAGDGMITALEALRVISESGRTLHSLASDMTQFPQILVNVRVQSKPSFESLPEVKAEMERLENDMQGRGRLLVRYSGTENLARVMIEGESQARIAEQANRLAAVIKKAIG